MKTRTGSCTISVLIPTVGRRDEPIHTLKRLSEQTIKPDEVVLVDQNAPPISELDECCQLLRQKNILNVLQYKVQPPGVALNYNRALQYATKDIVLYLDDDIDFDENLIETHLAAYADSDPRLGGVAGRVEQPSGDLPPESIQEFGVYQRWRGRLVARFNAKQKRDVELAPGGNMSFYRRVLLEIGGFDEGFDGTGYFFESDASLRVVSKGYRIVFEPKASVKHLMAPRGGARESRKSVSHFYFVKNGMRLYRRHSPRLGLPFFAGKMFFYSLAKALKNLDWQILRFGIEAMGANSPRDRDERS